MSEGEATATLEEPTVAESEKVKAINGMKEVDEVKLQNGESEKPQINGDMEKGEELDSEEQNGREEGTHEDIPKQKFSVAVDRTLVTNKEKEGKNGDKMEVDEEQKDDGDGKDEKESASDSAVDGEGENSEVEKEKDEDDKSEEKNSEKKKSDVKDVKDDGDDKSNDSEKKSEDKDGESKTEKKEKKDASDEKTASNDKKGENEKTPTKKDKNESNNNNNSTTKTKEGKRSKGNSTDEIQEIPVTRQLRARKTPKKYTEDDDDIKITNEVIKDDSSDIEMIEESDPLAISDADVKKIQKEKKEITIKSKDPNVIIIDTNTLLKNQGNLAAAVAQSNTGSGVQTIHPRSTSSSSSNTVTNMSIQSAIQAITGGAPAQGLQSAYITALQQVLVSQGGQVPMNPQHLAQLQQYYNSLGHLQDDAYVIEAPSFIVPYVMEGKPKEPIKDFLKRINKELEDFEKKELEEDENKRKEEERKKREAARLERRKRREEEKQKKLAAGEEVAEEEESEDEEEKKEKEKEENEKEERKEKDNDEEAKNDDEKKDEDEKMDTDEDKDGEKITKGDSDRETKDTEEKEDSGKENEKGADVKDKKKEEDEKEDTEKESTETDDAKSDKEDKEEEEESKKVDVEDQEKKDEKAEKKDAEAGDDDDKENKDKSDTDSVVDVEKDGQKGEDLSYLGNIQSQLHYKISQWEPYYKSALGKFMLELGLNQAQEFLQSDLLRMQKRKLDKMKTQPSREGIMGVKLLEKQLEVTRKKNSHLQVPLRICKFCTFKTESEMVMERHLESPHMVNYTYKCNFCDFETRGPQIILFHMEAEHNIRGRLERAPAFFQCSLCPYEDNNKSKMTRHSFSCAKKYKPERNCELLDWEPPAKIPKIHRGRPNTLGKAFEPVKMPNLLPKNLTGMNINLQGTNMIQGSSAAALSAARGRGRPIGSYKNVVPMQNQGRGVNTVSSGSLVYTNRGTTTSSQGSGSQQFTLGNQMFHLVNGHLVPMSSGSGSVSSVSISSQSGGRVPRILPSSNTSSSSSTNPVSLIPGLGASSSITIQSVQTKGGNTKSPQQPSISITPLPRGGQQPSQGGGGKGGSSQTRGGDSGGKPSFVICEICDGYIKDLEQLRNHMNLIHKVKIHPKMIYNRPPLNCQKCQHRFFTDQGLERHLLGTHGLVTSSMQEAANKGKDAGRCPICGKVFQWKLLNHVSRDHKMTLKPAHLSYKCTVCTATFNMYRLFENHVYSAHSVVNKNKGEGGKKGGGSSDSPLKINDEITIIPQPAAGKTKTTTTSSSSSSSEKTISKKSEGTPTMSKEITITKVGSRPTRRSGGSVEVISLDESPKKSSSNSNSGSDKKRSSKDNLGNSSKKSKTSS